MAQRLKRYVNGEEFERGCELATEHQLEKIREYVDNLDLAPLKKFIKKIRRDADEIEVLPYKELREVARDLNIRYWHELPMESLILEIQNARDASNNAKGSTGCDEDDSPPVRDL